MARSSDQPRGSWGHGKRTPGRRILRAEALEPRLVLSAAAAWQHLVPAALAFKSSSTVTLSPVADAYVSAASAQTNYGTASDLLVQNASRSFTSASAKTYLKFDLSGISGTITKAVLQLTPLSTSKVGAPISIGVHLLADSGDGWVEGSGGTDSDATGAITWSNAPSGYGKQLRVSGASLKASKSISINVTSLVNQKFNSNQIAGFELDATSWSGRQQWVDFASRENATVAFQPVLVVTTSGSTNSAPTLAQQPAASDLTTTTVRLSVLGASASGEQKLAYTWSVVSPAGATAPTFSSNGGNSSKNTTVTFSQAGTYVFTATIADPTAGLSVRSSSVTVTVDQSLTTIRVTPSNVTLSIGTTQLFAAQGLDQFGQSISGSLAGLTWSVSGGGTIDSAGKYTPPSTATVDTITAQATSATGSTVTGKATVTVTANTLGLKDSQLASVVQSLDADGSIGWADMLAIFRSQYTVTKGVVTADDLSDLKTILKDAATLNIAGYVQVLADDVINGNTANAHYQGKTLGNLAVGSTATQLDQLVSKWFLGADRPDTGGYTYSTVTGSLYTSSGPSHNDEYQGYLGDCYLIASLGAIADSSQAAVDNMVIDNGVDSVTGVHAWTVRFYVNGTADYVTVDDKLPTDGYGNLVFQGCDSSVSNPQGLWLALVEKAYAQWNETGNEGRDGKNSYSSIEGGWMADVDAQVLGRSATSYGMISSSDLVAGVTKNMAVTIATVTSYKRDGSLSYGLYGNHAYTVIGYNSTTQTFTLYNPWGCCQPTKSLTWAELKTVCDGFVVADTSGTKSAAAAGVAGAMVRPVVAALPAAQVAAEIDPANSTTTADSTARTGIQDSTQLAATAVDAVLTGRATSVRSDSSASAAGLDLAIDLSSFLARSRPSRTPGQLATLAADEFFQTI